MTFFSKPTASRMTWANQSSMGDIITLPQVGCVLPPFSLASLQFPVSGTPYTYHNGLAMFTADTGQHTALGLALQQLPAKGAAAAQSATQPFPLLYGERKRMSFFLKRKYSCRTIWCRHHCNVSSYCRLCSRSTGRCSCECDPTAITTSDSGGNSSAHQQHQQCGGSSSGKPGFYL